MHCPFLTAKVRSRIKTSPNRKMHLAGKKAWITRQINDLQLDYDWVKSPGVKASIKRKMNELARKRNRIR